jgi:hypothetical protein
MRTGLRGSLIVFALLATAPSVVHSQVGFPGGIRESGRQVIDEGRPPDAAAAFIGGGGPKLSWFIGSGGRTSDSGHGFSALAGGSLEGVAFPVEAAFGYARSDPDDLEETNSFSATVEVAMPSGAFKALGTKLAVSGESVWTPDVDWSYSAALSATQPVGEYFELVGGVTYGASNPEVGETSTGFRPTASLGAVPADGTAFRLEYTFDNDLDGEDSVEFRVTQRIKAAGMPPVQLRGAIAKHGVVSVGILLFP